MSSGLVIATRESGGGIAMMGIVVLLGAVVGLVYLVSGRQHADGKLDRSEQRPDEGGRSDRSLEPSDRSPAP